MVQTIDTQPYASLATPRKVLHMGNERTAGSIPSYGTQVKTNSYEDVHALSNDTIPLKSATSTPETDKKENSFKFSDFLDMINPLQHIPLVNLAYRAITHDDIKPISEIIGGAVFGGAVGAASGLVNTIIREETGKDIAGNLMSLVKKDDVRQQNDTSPYEDLPASLLAFAEKPLPTSEIQIDSLNWPKQDTYTDKSLYKYKDFDEDRTAGKMIIYS